MDESDNDPERFLTYVIAALRRVSTLDAEFGADALNRLQAPQPYWDVVLTSLINEISATNTPILFVLDDYHLIESQIIQDFLTFVLQRLSPQLHLVIITRIDPPLPIARLRVRGLLTELRAIDLRFTSAEISAFLNQLLIITLSQANIDALAESTEGWIAGLQLAALSLQGQADVSAFI